MKNLRLIMVFVVCTICVNGITINLMYRTSLNATYLQMMDRATEIADLVEKTSRYRASSTNGQVVEEDTARVNDIGIAYPTFSRLDYSDNNTSRQINALVFYNDNSDSNDILLGHTALLLNEIKMTPKKQASKPPILASIVLGEDYGIDDNFVGSTVIAKREEVEFTDIGTALKTDVSNFRARCFRAAILSIAYTILIVLFGILLITRTTRSHYTSRTK